MFDQQMKSTGRQYTTTAALLAIGLVFIPAACIFLLPGIWGLLTACVASLTSVLLAVVVWKKSSQLTIPTLEAPRPGAK